MRMLGRILIEEAGGLVVAEAHDGEQAMSLLLEHDPDLVLMDYQMPGIDGVETTSRIQALRPQTTVVAWTSSEDPDVQERFARAGAAASLIKTDLEGLRAVLRQHLRGEPAP
jgi:CheY-like chemotaxis protein